MKRILLIHHGQGLGGGLVALLGLINELRIENQVTVLCVFHSEAVDYLKRNNVDVIYPLSSFYSGKYDLFIHSDASYFSIPGLIRTMNNLILYFISMIHYAPKELNKLKEAYDIVYLNSLFISDWAYAAKKNKKKVVIHVREPLSSGFLGIRKWIIKSVLRKYTDLIITVSEDNKNRIGLPEKTVRVYDPIGYHDRNGMAPTLEVGYKYFTFVGGSQRIKGFEQLVNSLKYLNKDIKIFFLGHTHELNQLNQTSFKIRALLSAYLRRLPLLKQTLKNAGNIVHIGITDQVFNYYKHSVGVISPFSAPHASLPVLEAFSIGKPVIVSDVKGSDELVNSQNGIIFKNGDARDLARAINEMASLSESHLQVMQNACVEKINRVYDSNPSIADLLNRI